uniref:Uncharacterized protein n=1 Tax=Anthurium amnicola TaxID=1678845 RepID=A0A1D1YU41_9ARAE
MAPFHFRGMKGVNISCASPASTATCSSMDPRRSVSRHGRAIDRLQAPGPHLRDSRWAASALNWVPPSPSKLKSYAHKGRKSSEAPANLVSPAASSRYLLGDDDAFFDVFPDLDPLPAFIPINSARFRSVTGDDDSPALKPSSSSSVAAAASRVGPVCLGASSSSSSSSTSSLPPARLLQITKGDGSPALGPPASTRPPYLDHLEPAAVASPPSPRFEIVQGDDDSAVIESPPGRLLQGHAFFRASSSLSETRFHTTKGEDSAVLKPSSSARARDQVQDILLFNFLYILSFPNRKQLKIMCSS